MKLDPDLWAVVKECAERHPADITKAVKTAHARIKKMEKYEMFVEELVLFALRDAVQDARHIANRIVKREAGAYSQQGKVKSTDSASVRRAASAIFNLYVAGSRLGELRGAELLPASQSERECGLGHIANADLCEKLSRLVPHAQTVRSSVTAAKCYELWQECNKKNGVGETADSGGAGNGDTQRLVAATPSV